MNNVKYIQTKNLDAIIYPHSSSGKDMKLAIYNSYHSPYGYDKRDLIVSHYGVKQNEFTFDYVKSKVDEVYSTFSNEEIHKLLNKVKQYNDSK
tara:strand:+ start:175 stop:453 length:279 start_codon:yes stop_codon:yes gene_type:complete